MSELKPERLAEIFHTNYERLAPEFGYKTREASAVEWKDVPEPNRGLMIATCGAVMQVMEQRFYAEVARWKAGAPFAELADQLQAAEMKISFLYNSAHADKLDYEDREAELRQALKALADPNNWYREFDSPSHTTTVTAWQGTGEPYKIARAALASGEQEAGGEKGTGL